MKKHLKLLSAVCLLLSGISAFAQNTSAGKCFYVDYAQWCDLGYPSIYINCGNDPAFNTGSQLTMEVWARAYIFGENRKILGKMSNTLNNGYVLGFENLNVYSEIFNPDHQEVPHSGTGPMPADSAWVHIVTTYDANGQMVNYVNGVNVGETTVFPSNPITASDAPFVIGLAPWDMLSYEFTGGLDEVRIWNVALSESEIRNNMFRTLSGNEPGLVAYYNFNNDVDSVVHDDASLGLNGILKNPQSTCFSWAASDAPVGDSIMSGMTDINASWFGKNATQFTYAVTTNGLSLITSIGSKEYWKNVLFGHNNLTGKTNADAPAGAPVDFERLSRIWYVNQNGQFSSQVVFNTQDASGGGSTITSGGPDSLYTLLKRNDSTGNFQAVCSASTVMGNTVLFNGVQLENGYYTLGYSSEMLAGPASAGDEAETGKTLVFPNPAVDKLNIGIIKKSTVTLSDLSGKIIMREKLDTGIHIIDVASLSRGVYMLMIESEGVFSTDRIILQ